MWGVIMRLKTAMLKEEEKYRGIVRISKSVGVQPGEYVLIKGKTKTAVKVWTKNCDKKLIWLDEITAENASIKIGDYVEVEKFEPAIAKKVVLAGDEISAHTWLPRMIAKSEEDLIKLVLDGRVLSVGEVVAVRGLSTNIPVFYEVLESDPLNFVVVSSETKIKWHKK